jgi:hypothetical protein
MYQSWRRNILRNQLACHSAHTDLLGAFDKTASDISAQRPTRADDTRTDNGDSPNLFL